MIAVIISVCFLMFVSYFLRNRKAVAKFLRGYGAYELYAFRKWSDEAKQFELADINDTCIVYEIT